ncbi:hypothetical protein E2C01_077053 [Portunus trituberculatus]|uniref:Uncharacterized protein n=1 Tax=Portunus trituberculatus TaxID=210409 RepID=A0A5B7INI8_PORTR|nr:hypothetical protein [Portunus trituberculatus]
MSQNIFPPNRTRDRNSNITPPYNLPSPSPPSPPSPSLLFPSFVSPNPHSPTLLPVLPARPPAHPGNLTPTTTTTTKLHLRPATLPPSRKLTRPLAHRNSEACYYGRGEGMPGGCGWVISRARAWEGACLSPCCLVASSKRLSGWELHQYAKLTLSTKAIGASLNPNRPQPTSTERHRHRTI